MPELTKRILSALVAAPVFLYLTWLGGWIFMVALVVVAMVIQLEIIYMLEKQGMHVIKLSALLLGVPVLLIPVIPGIAWIIFLMLLLITLLMITFGSNRNGWNGLMSTILVAVLVPALLSGLLMLRSFGDEGTGFILTATLLLMVWVNDIFAYFGGKTMGKHTLAPTISPSKTLEGFISGFLGSIIALALCQTLIPGFPLDWPVSIPFAVLIGFFGPAGDLAESKLKRTAGIKDSSGLMPGHGGLFDRFDAVLFSAPFAAVYFQMIDYLGFM